MSAKDNTKGDGIGVKSLIVILNVIANESKQVFSIICLRAIEKQNAKLRQGE